LRDDYLAELAFSALGGVEWDNMVTDFDIGDTLSDRFYNSATFVSANDGEGTFRILAGERVGVCMANLEN